MTGPRDLVVETRGLTRRFGELNAVDGLDMKVQRGRVTGFLGPNGAGKTTTMRLLLGLLQPNAGEIELFGSSFAANPLALLARVGALIETPCLYGHLSGRENLEINRRLLAIEPSEVDRVLGFAELEDAAERRVSGYSLGMRQRLGLALALLGRPELLILDEPTNGLDPVGMMEMRQLLQRLADEDGMSVLVSSHLLSEIEQVASHLVVLRQGRCVYQGPIEAFMGQGRTWISVDQPREAIAALEAHGWSALIESNEARTGLVVDAAGPEARAEICRLLVTAGFAVDQLRDEASSLEDVFFEVTAQ